MAVQLILKNSSIEDRRPSAAQLANGEISLNYNEAGPFVACKDTAGNIQSLGGVKFSSDAPADPPIGAWWFSTAFSSLFVYDGTTWLAVGGGGGGGGGSIDAVLGGEGIDTTVAGTVVTVEVELAEGRDGLEFDADRLKATTASKTAFGSVSVGDNIDVSAAGEISIPLATETVPGIVKIGNGIDVDINGTISVDIPQTLNYRGSCLLANSPTGQINPNPPVLGDAYINGEDASAINAGWTGLSGSSAAGDIVVWDGTEWELIGTGGTAYWDRTGTILSPSNAGDKAQTASTVDSDPDATLVTKDYLEDQRVTTSDTAPVAADSRDGDLWWNTNDGRLYVYYEDADSSQWVDASPDSQVSSEYWKRIAGPYLAPDNDGDGIDINGGKITLSADGSAEFMGDITTNASLIYLNPNNTANAIAKINVVQENGTSGGVLRFYTRTHGDAVNVEGGEARLLIDSTGDVKIGGTLPAAPAIELKTDGSITAAGNIKSGGSIQLEGPLTSWVDGLQMFSSASAVGTIATSNGPSGGPGTLTFQSGQKETLRIDEDGNIRIGGTLPASPDILLNADGSAEFKGDILSDTNVYVGDYDLTSTTSSGARLQSGILKIQRSSSVVDSASALEVHKGTQQVAGILADGSAEFKGQVIQDNASSTTDGGFWARKASDNSNVLYATTSIGAVRVSVKGDGSAQFAGNVRIGGPSSAPNISLNADGTADFAGGVQIGPSYDNVFLSPGLGDSTRPSQIVINGRPTLPENDALRVDSYTASGTTATNVARVRWDGSATFAGAITSGTFLKTNAQTGTSDNFQFAIYREVNDYLRFNSGRSDLNPAPPVGYEFWMVRNDNSPHPVFRISKGDHIIGIGDSLGANGGGTPKIQLKQDGSAEFKGTVTAPNVTFNLEADDETKYTATTNEEGEETLVYNGATLDVKDRLQKANAALLALKTAAVAATDFASLQAAIVTALADI